MAILAVGALGWAVYRCLPLRHESSASNPPAGGALPKLPRGEVTVRVVGEDGKPVPEAKVTIGFEKLVPFQSIEQDPATGKTNANGVFSAKGTFGGQRVGGHVEGEGFYRSQFVSPLLFDPQTGRPEFLDPTIDVVLKRIGKPIPMYARKVTTDVPALDLPTGFDLVVGDWVAPAGRGQTVDLIFILKRRYASAMDYESWLTWEFSGATDGVLNWDTVAGNSSALKSPRFAPLEGYERQRTFLNHHLPKNPLARTDSVEQRNYFIRVRTEVDTAGKIVTALYGKIVGDIQYSPIRSETCTLSFTYYLNPTPNDRNLEFDPGRNLFKNLKDNEEVNAP